MAKIKKLKLALKVLLGVFLCGVLSGASLFVYYAKDLPRPEIFTERPFVLPTKIYDRTGEVLLYQIYEEEKRTVVPLSQIPDFLVKAAVAAEDANFYRHFGLDFRGIARSVLHNLKIGSPVYGGSTISQQLIRSSFLTLDKTAQRKTKEIILTLELERRYSKDEIMEFYLNQVPFGANAYGVEAAAQAFFGKPVAEISLAQAALLVSLIQAPSRLSPYGSHQKDLLARKDYVLERMVEESYISPEEAKAAKNEILVFAEMRQPIKAPHFALYVKDYLEQKYTDSFLKEKGLSVYTSIDWELQQAAEEMVQVGVKNNKGYNAHNASLVALDPKTGEILALVGSADWYEAESFPEGCSASAEGCLFDPKFDVATLGQRQPGSAFKPFAYAEAFRNGLTAETILWDVMTEFNPNCASTADQEKDEYGLDCYHPANYTGKFKGPLTIREALAQSINIPAIKTLYLAGLQRTIDLAKSCGISTLDKSLSFYGLSLVLGGGEVKLLDLASAYGVFATRGLSVPPVSILKIEDSSGNIIEENKKTPKRVLEPEIADLINSILSDNEARTPIFGANSLLYIPPYQVAVKTGTTQEYKDGWTVGYTPSVVVGVWVGNNNNASMLKEPGVVLAGPIWNQFMRKILTKYPIENFTEPKPNEADKPVLKGEIDWENPHSILHYIKDSPALDPQYLNWEEGIKNWITSTTASF